MARGQGEHRLQVKCQLEELQQVSGTWSSLRSGAWPGSVFASPEKRVEAFVDAFSLMCSTIERSITVLMSLPSSAIQNVTSVLFLAAFTCNE